MGEDRGAGETLEGEPTRKPQAGIWALAAT